MTTTTITILLKTPTVNAAPRCTAPTVNRTALAADQQLPGPFICLKLRCPANLPQAAVRRRTAISWSNGSQLDDLLQMSLLQMEQEREEKREERKRPMELNEEEARAKKDEKEYQRRKEEKREEEQRRQHEQDRLRQERLEQQQLQFQQVFTMIMAKSMNTEDKHFY
jgi:hypothetical protein